MDFFESDMCNPKLTPDMLKRIVGDKSKKVDVYDKFIECLYDDLGAPVDVSHRNPNLRIQISVSDNKLKDKNLRRDYNL